LQSGISETSFFATSSDDPRLPDRVAADPAPAQTPRQTRKRRTTITIDDEDEDPTFVDSSERNRPRSAAEKAKDAEDGRERAKILNRGLTPIRRRSFLRNNSVKFTGTGAPSTPTPKGTAPPQNTPREATPGPTLSSPYRSPYVAEEDEEDGGVGVTPDNDPVAEDGQEDDQEEEEHTPAGNAFSHMTPQQVKILTSAMSAAELGEFMGTPKPRTRRRLDDEFRAVATPRTDAEDARQRNANFLASISNSAKKRKRDASAAMMSGGLGTPPATGGRDRDVTPPATPSNDPRTELEILQAICASQSETIRLQNLRHSRNIS
jgi:hypothetical protein